MKVIRSIPQLHRWIEGKRNDGKTIGFVPTLGALHKGHISLIHQARNTVGPKGIVAVSIFVNPTQFNQKSDFKKYPRQFKTDRNLCLKAGVDLIFCPSAKSMYPPDFSTWIEECTLSLPLCGAYRPGHFRGVCTVVLKLLNLVQPHFAFFGQKDAQQALVIQRIVRDLNVPVRIKIASTIRENNGLAMSSRNQRLSPSERNRATALYQTLKLVQHAFWGGNKNAAALKKLARRHLKRVPDLRLDYFELVDHFNLQAIKRVSKGNLAMVAAFIGKIRLIDNLSL